MLSVNKVGNCTFRENLLESATRQTSAQQIPPEMQQVSNNSPQNSIQKDGNKKGTKILLGLGALALLTIVGVLVHKKIKLGKTKDITDAAQDIARDLGIKNNEVLADIEKMAKPCKTAGKTIQESINNTFESDAALLNPHTYDKSKETVMVVMENYGGFKSVSITPDNKMVDDWTRLAVRRPIGKNYNDYIGEIGISQNTGERFVTLNFPSLTTDTAGNAIPHSITILSKDGELTPVQKDLLKIINRDLSDKEKKLFAIATLRDRMKGHDGDQFYGNYDSILSLIQTLANKVL